MTAPGIRRVVHIHMRHADGICALDCKGCELDPTEQATIDRFEAAPAAEESLREAVLWAMVKTDYDVIQRDWRETMDAEDVAEYERLADAAIAVMRGAA